MASINEDEVGKIEIEVDDEEMVFDPETDAIEPEMEEIEIELDTSFGANLAEQLDDDLLRTIGQDRQDLLQDLGNSRGSWEERIRQGIKWLGITTDDASANSIEGACTAVHPLLMENVIKFQAKAIQELWPAKGPVRTKVKGFVDAKREAAAARVRTYMNYQLTEQVRGFYSDLERNLFRVGFMGTGIRKAGWNALAGAPDPSIVYVENFYVDPATTHLKHADEYIEVMELSERKKQNLELSGVFRTCEDDTEASIEQNEITEALNEAQGFEVQLERRGYKIGEAHCYLDLDGGDPLVPAGTTAPYIVHFNVQTGYIYAIRRNWREADAAREMRLWYAVDQFIPAFGFYGLGFVHLIGDLAASSTATLRALVDAGQYANWPGGYKSQDAKVAQSDTPLSFGEFRDVNMSPEELKNAFFPLPVKEPSQVLFALLQFMVASGQKFADTTDQVVAESSNYGPVVTTLALLEASQRFYSSIHKRLHQSQHDFFRIIGELNYENLPDTINFVVGNENGYVQRDDFSPELVDIVPASDPNALSESQRVAKAQVELDIAARFPQLHDMREALRRFYAAMGTDSPEKLLPDPEASALTADPLTEIQAAMKGRPIKAQLGQNHNAHIVVKEAFMKSPQMQGTNDPTIAVGSELLKANIAEHKVLIFVAQIGQLAQQAGLPMQDENVQAQIAQQLMAMSAESGAPGAGPSTEQQMIELNRRELDIAEQRLQSQDIREAADIAMKNRKLDIEEAEAIHQMRQDQRDAERDAASKILDSSAKMAQIDAQRLSRQAEGYGV